MSDQINNFKPHLFPLHSSESKPFKAHTPKGGAKPVVPEVNREQHGSSLRSQLAALQPVANSTRQRQEELGLEASLGIQIQFLSMPEAELAFEKLAAEGRNKGIELLSVQELDGKAAIGNVFVPDGQLQHFEQLVTDYLNEKTSQDGRKLDNKKLLNTIESIRTSAIHGLWTDSANLLPESLDEEFWWEVWLRRDKTNGQACVNDFRRLAELTDCKVSNAVVNFPERSVLIMFGSQRKLTQTVMTLNCVAELRRAKETAEFFTGLRVAEQLQWSTDLLSRLTFAPDDDTTPRVCLLDSGVNRGHPLLAPLIADVDMHTVKAAWGVNDAANHGTGLAGIAAYGDLFQILASENSIAINHRLESVKLTPDHQGNLGDEKHHAKLFIDAVTLPETYFGQRKRVFSSAVSASDYRDNGRPSAWSATIDSLASDDLGEGAFPRLFVLAAGNIHDSAQWTEYPNSVTLNQIHDPGQAWNALTIGAYTEKVTISEIGTQDFTPVAPQGALSPFTTTSSLWDERAWPLKPDVVFEGGNAASDGVIADNFASLELLTTNNNPLHRLLWTTNATSAASALCARMAAQIMVAYPTMRPETIRALIVHSAEWTDSMLNQFEHRTQKNWAMLIRHCGWGVPSLQP